MEEIGRFLIKQTAHSGRITRVDGGDLQFLKELRSIEDMEMWSPQKKKQIVRSTKDVTLTDFSQDQFIYRIGMYIKYTTVDTGYKAKLVISENNVNTIVILKSAETNPTVEQQ